MEKASASRKKVIIVGGGFAGLSAAKKLGASGGVDVTLLDRRNHHLFQPLLYQVATAGLSPADIAVPIRAVLSPYKHVQVLLDEVLGVERTARSVSLAGGEVLAYDYLLLACGATHSYFGKGHWEDFAPGLKTIEQATEIRRRILLSFEEAEKARDPDIGRASMSGVIVGGGPTGVELAGSLAELGRTVLARDFRNIDPTRARVILVEAGPRILSMFDEELSKHATADLEGMGVQVWTSTKVEDITSKGVQIGKDFISSRNVLWAAGVAPSPLAKLLGAQTDRVGRVMIEPELHLKGDPTVYALGDMACFVTERGVILPGLAPVALQQGRHAAANILLHLKGKELKQFEYVDKGSMATIGRKKAVMERGALKDTGFTAWVAWLLVHIYFLIGFRNRAAVMLQWAWSYMTYKRGARLIVNKEWKG